MSLVTLNYCKLLRIADLLVNVSNYIFTDETLDICMDIFFGGG